MEGLNTMLNQKGRAMLDNPEMSVMLPAYIEKYGALIQDMGWTPASIAADYSRAIRVTPTKFKSWA